MDIKEAAALLDGDEYLAEGSRELFRSMQANRLVAVFGASDDITELRGAIDDELGTALFHVDAGGLMKSKCEEGEDCPYFRDAIFGAASIKPIFSPSEEDFTFIYRTTIPHETFVIKEDDEAYCRGIVFSLDRLTA